MSLLSENARDEVISRSEDLLRAGLAWQDRPLDSSLERLQLEAPTLYRRVEGGRFESVESALRKERLDSARKQQPELPGLFENIVRGIEWADRRPPMVTPRDRTGVGSRSGPEIQLTTDGVCFFRECRIAGWSPNEQSTERLWLLDDEISGRRDFSELVALHESLCALAGDRASRRWVWDHLLAWFGERAKTPAGQNLYDYIQASYALEPKSWVVALRLEGVRLEVEVPQPEGGDEPIAISWMGHQIVCGLYMVTRILDELIPDRDHDLYESNESWWKGNQWACAILGTDWLLFSPQAGDRHTALYSRVAEAPELCALLTVFDSTTGPRDRLPVVARSSSDLFAVLIPTKTVDKDGIGTVPQVLTELPRDFLSHQELSHELVLFPDYRTRSFEKRLEALSRGSADFHLLKSEAASRRQLVNAIRRTVARLARARSEPDSQERNFLLVSALDALLVGRDVKGREHGATFVERFLSLAISEQHESKRLAAKGVVDRAWKLRNSFAHGDTPRASFSDDELESFERMAVSVTRRLFLSATSWSSLEEFRTELSERSAETLAKLRSLDQLENVPPADEVAEAN